MNGFWDLFIGEPGGVWIIGLVGLGIGVFRWLQRERAPRVILQELSTARLLDMHPSQHDRVQAYYAPAIGSSRQIKDLIQKKLVIYNGGTKDVLDAVSLELTLSPGARSTQNERAGLLECVVESPAKAQPAIDGEGKEGVQISIPYLNSYREHGHLWTLHLLAERPFDVALSCGSGKGWSARLLTREALFRLKLSATRWLALPTCLVLGGVSVWAVAWLSVLRPTESYLAWIVVFSL